MVIRNLSVQTAYFQNGLVKAKSSWQLEHAYQHQASSQPESASILSKTVRQPTMFTLTWFPIKCTTTSATSTVEPRQLPTPITATTINTHFEIYELMYNCEYVLNVRLVHSPSAAVLLNQHSNSAAQQPQIASAQFRVTSCERIAVVGRIKPICLSEFGNDLNAPSEDELVLSPTSTVASVNDFSSSTSTQPTKTTLPSNPLPKITEIRYKRIDSHTLEFYWSLPFAYNRALVSGYQISVVPKDIPGVDGSSRTSLFSSDSSSSSASSAGTYFGSVGAIVGPDQHSFMVRQLTPRVRYIFQIMAIGVDGQTSGPASSIEFRLSAPRPSSHSSSSHQEAESHDADESGRSGSGSSEARLVDAYRHTTTSDYYYLNDASTSRTASYQFALLVMSVVMAVRRIVE